MTRYIFCKRYGEILFQTVASAYLLHFVQNGSSKSILKICLHNNLKHLETTRPGFHLGAPKKRKVWTKPNSYKRYREILFQKVALGYLLHFVQNGSPTHILKQICLHNNLKHLETTWLGFHFGAPKKRKVRAK